MKYIKIDVPDYNDSYTYFGFGGKVYQLRFTWNDTEKRWMFGVYNDIREPLITGMKVVPNYPLNLFSGIDELRGRMFIVSTTLEAVGRYDFLEGNASFYYVEPED